MYHKIALWLSLLQLCTSGSEGPGRVSQASVFGLFLVGLMLLLVKKLSFVRFDKKSLLYRFMQEISSKYDPYHGQGGGASFHLHLYRST